MKTITKAHGYTRTYVTYGIGYPGYSFTITRDSDGATMRSGPGTNPAGDGYRHPDWQALPTVERERIVADLKSA
jgi:hypothetical protein